jgi:hypothetical protein
LKDRGFTDVAESSFPAGILMKSTPERFCGEVRPVLRDKDELRIGALPEEKVRDPLLSARADEEIGIGDPCGIKVSGESFLDELFLGIPGVLEQSADRAQDLIPPSVTQGNDKVPSVVPFRFTNHPTEVGYQGFGEGFVISNQMEPDLMPVEFFFLLEDVVFEELEKELNLLFRTLPVFRTEGIEGKPGDLPLAGTFEYSLDRLNPLLVPLDAGKPPGESPATIPVHNEGDMTRDPFLGEIERRDLGGTVHRQTQTL